MGDYMLAISFLTLCAQPVGLVDTQYQPERIYKLEEIHKHIEKDQEDLLIVFDVDEVLITSKDAFIHPECDSIFMKILRREFAKAKTPEEKQKLEYCLSLSLLKPERTLVEESTASFIRHIQDLGIKTIALTSCPTGKLGLVPKIEHWRIDHLQKMGIDFSASFASLDGSHFSEVPKKEVSFPDPLFEKGILFSYGYSKGEVLEAFLARMEWKPSKILFIDDLVENHHSLDKHLKTLAIPFLGFHYLGAILPPERIDVNLIEFQFDHLMEYEEWLSDEAIHLMKNTTKKEVVDAH